MSDNIPLEQQQAYQLEKYWLLQDKYHALICLHRCLPDYQKNDDYIEKILEITSQDQFAMLKAIKAYIEKGIQLNIAFLATCEQNREDDDLYQGGKSFSQFRRQFEIENPGFNQYGQYYITFKFALSKKKWDYDQNKNKDFSQLYEYMGPRLD